MRVAVVARPRARGAPASARGEGAIACARIVRRARPGCGARGRVTRVATRSDAR
jgi:hypothetical protein